jgi:zinc transporter ZupT
MALLVDEKRTATVRCRSDAVLFRLGRETFESLVKTSPGLSMAVSRLLARRLDKISARHVETEKERRKWKDMVLRNVTHEVVSPTPVDIKAAAAAAGGAPLAIWLGILMDGIPESAVVGASIGPGRMVGIALFAGIFLSNIPEALSSAVGMRRGGHGRLRIVLMWGSLVLFSGICAALGNLVCSSSSSEVTIAVVQGLGAGAILTMVAETMLPEAFEQGGSVVGISTLLGFLAAYFFNGL